MPSAAAKFKKRLTISGAKGCPGLGSRPWSTLSGRFYRWAINREMVFENPASLIQLRPTKRPGSIGSPVPASSPISSISLPRRMPFPGLWPVTGQLGHKAPKPQAGAAPITLRRYTHVLDASSSALVISSTSSSLSANGKKDKSFVSAASAVQRIRGFLPFSLSFEGGG
jgi:hypothetical protein